MIPCICLDDKNKPDEIPLRCWIEAGKKYTITHIYFQKMQGIQGVDLKEVKLDESCYPFETYKLSRFGIRPQDIEALVELAKACTDLNDLDIRELLQEELEVQNYE